MNDRTKRILTDLGTLLTPTTLVAVFCQAVGVDSQSTAVYSLASIVFVACCYYRTWINARLSSALILAVASGLGVIFFANYDNILLKDTGLIKRYHESTELQADLGRYIESARHEIWMFGTNFHTSTVDRRPTLLNQLRAGVKVRYLILDPHIPTLPTIADDFDQSVTELRDECIKGLKDLIELRRQWEQIAATVQRPGELEIRLYERTPSARIYAFDPNFEQGHTIFVPYMHGFNSPNLPAYLFGNGQTGVAPLYLDGLKKLWLKAEPLDTFLARHGGTPDVQQTSAQ